MPLRGSYEFFRCRWERVKGGSNLAVNDGKRRSCGGFILVYPSSYRCKIQRRPLPSAIVRPRPNSILRVGLFEESRHVAAVLTNKDVDGGAYGVERLDARESRIVGKSLENSERFVSRCHFLPVLPLYAIDFTATAVLVAKLARNNALRATSIHSRKSIIKLALLVWRATEKAIFASRRRLMAFTTGTTHRSVVFRHVCPSRKASLRRKFAVEFSTKRVWPGGCRCF